MVKVKKSFSKYSYPLISLNDVRMSSASGSLSHFRQLFHVSVYVYTDQDPYRDPCPEDCTHNADALFHVSVSVKLILIPIFTLL